MTISESPRSPESQWFWDHHDVAVQQIVDTTRAVGLSLEGLEVADIGCGDGSMSLGVLTHTHPRRVVGYDLNPISVDHLRRRCVEEGLSQELPPNLTFEQSSATRIPAADDTFDFAYSWSAFEHIADPAAVLREIRRIIRPGGHFFLQLWPFYHSANGSHLWEWFPEPFHHLKEPESVIAAELRESPLKSPEWTAIMAHEFEWLNRVTLDQLQRAVLGAGFTVVHLELMTGPTPIPEGLSQYSWTDLAISGIKLVGRADG